MYRPILLALAYLVIGCAAPASTAGEKNAAAYDLTIEIFPESHTLLVEGEVSLPSTPAARASVELLLSDTAANIAWTDPDGRPAQARKLRSDDGETVWRIAGRWAAGKAINLGFRYRLVTPEPKGFLYIGPEIAFGAGGWYPTLADTTATATLRIRTRSDGVLSSIGRSAGPRRERDINAQTFAPAAPGQLLFALSPGGSAVSLSPALALTTLRPRADEASWRSGLAGVSRALQAEFGPLPHDHVTIIEIPDAIADKAGFGAFATSGAVLARSGFFDQPFNVPAFSHEFAHLWWGNHIQLAGKQGDYLLDEGLAQYGSMVATDRVLGAAAGTRYRREGWPGFNEGLFSALGYLKIAAAGADRPLLQLPDDGLSYWIAYSKAGLAWYALAQEIGPANFSRALKQVAAEHGAGRVSWPHFIEAVQRHAKTDVNPFVTAWFGTSGAADYALEWKSEPGTVVGTVRQSGALKPATLELELVSKEGARSRHTIRATDEATNFRIPTGASVASVALDPDYKILRWTPAFRDEAEALASYMRATVRARLDGKPEAETLLLASLQDGDNRYDRALLARASLVRLSEERGCAACAKGHLKAALALPPQRLARLTPTYIGLALAGRRLGEIALAEQAAALARSGDALAGNANGAAMKLAAPAANGGRR